MYPEVASVANIKSLLNVSLLALALACAPARQAQQPEADADKNAVHARAVLNQMIEALGGNAWLNLKNEYREGRAAAFYQGKPTGGTIEYYEYHSWKNGDRIEFTKHHDVVQIYKGDQGWEITYRGLKPLPKDQLDEFLRRKNHSIESAVKLWLKDPRSILIYDGQHLAARHNADKVTIISPENDSVTLYLDVQTHLPLKKTFQWRNPIYKDFDSESEEYDNYRPVDGIPTPFTVTRFKNDDMVSQKFLFRAQYNQAFPPDLFDEKAAENRLKK